MNILFNNMGSFTFTAHCTQVNNEAANFRVIMNPRQSFDV